MKNPSVIFLLFIMWFSYPLIAQDEPAFNIDSFLNAGVPVEGLTDTMPLEEEEAIHDAEVFPVSSDEAPLKLHPVDTSGWGVITDNISYDEESEKRKEEELIPKTDAFLLPAIILANLKFIFLGIAILLAAAIIIYMIRQTRNVRTEELLNWDEIEDISEVREKDLLGDLEKSLMAGDYKMAIRLRFLLLLKEMVSRGLLTWRKEKTNTDYRYELSAHSCSDLFNHAAFIFDLVWYGERPADEKLYNQMKETQEDIFKQISHVPKVEAGE